MISVADLIKENRIPANFFDYNAYVKGDLEIGILENRRGDRLLAVPDTLIASLYSGLAKETGQASRLVLFNCGKWWGKNFYTRFTESLEEYYCQTLAEMDMITFIQSLKECWKTHGWGIFEFDPQYQAQGFIFVKTYNSPYVRKIEGNKLPTGYLEAGILTSFFSRLTGRELLAVQTTCESLGASNNTYIIGLPERLQIVDSFLSDGLDHETILQKLLK
ncbi:V4R domain-containing protein [Pseudanabaena yagii]|uniref:4-vinyl reductase n=1 Tax=Pseudanabaena yagii GIHE-NHR1 TaxID=2722753 RepID=A0ABX1LZ21_9CYAN|nr:V4R domain-containing protein [Pseudanabaena yagii]NMF60601.1 4-vinyl reductase [Pseudanabaena yagii GIHE-NHR1]